METCEPLMLLMLEVEIAYGEFSIGVTSTDNSENVLPSEYSLDQNYPNPFNPITTINFSIPKEGMVTLNIYNAIGQEVVTLINEIKHVGNYNLQFNASSLPSGIYFYQLKANSYVETKKMVLLK